MNPAGVPALLGGITFGAAQVLLAADAIAGFLLGPPQWGLYLDGEPIIIADSVTAFEYKAEWTVSDYPLEQGAFQSYDKVQVPFDVRIRFVAGGSDEDRAALLDSIGAAAASLTLYDAVTPEIVYPSVNITHFDYRRTATNGVGLLAIDVWAVQVRVSASAQFSNTQSPSGASPSSGGTVSPTSLTPAQSQIMGPANVGSPGT